MDAKDILAKWKMTEKEKELIRVLRGICDEDDFVLGIIADLESDEEREMVLDYIRQNKHATTSELTLVAFFIDEDREAKE